MYKVWIKVVKQADWGSINDFQQTFGSADPLGSGSSRVCFNVGGNNYRIICKVHFGDVKCHLFICWIRTHSEYDIICKRNQQ